MSVGAPSYSGFRFPAEIISSCVWLYHRFPLSFREVEEMMLQRRVVVSHETIRQWCAKFGQTYANGLRRRRPRPGDTWHLDEVFITIQGKTHYLWRAVDRHGTVLDILVTSRRDTTAATRFFRTLLTGLESRAPGAGHRQASQLCLGAAPGSAVGRAPSVEVFGQPGRELSPAHPVTRTSDEEVHLSGARVAVPVRVQRGITALPASPSPAWCRGRPPRDDRPVHHLEPDRRSDHGSRLRNCTGDRPSSPTRVHTHIGSSKWNKLTMPCGEYLEQTACEGLGGLRARGWRVEIVCEAVTGALRAGTQVVLHTDHELHKPFDYTVLAVGGDSLEDIYGLVGVPNVAREPIPYELRHFVPDRVHALSKSYQVQLSHVLGLLGRELAEVGADLDEVSAEISCVGREPPAARLRRQLGEVASERAGLRVLQKALHVCGPDLWPLLPGAMKRDVLGTYYRTLMSLRCPMPPCSAETLLGLMDSGWLEVLSGVRRVAAVAAGGFQVTTGDQELRVCHVVNGVSAASHRVPLGARRLVNALCREGLGVTHPDGGLCVQASTSCLTGDPVGPEVYAISDLAAGTFFFTFGVPSLIDRCREILTSRCFPRNSNQGRKPCL